MTTEKKEFKAFNDEDPFEMLDVGECYEVEMSMKGEEVKASACRVDEDTVEIESDEMDFEGTIKRSEYEKSP